MSTDLDTQKKQTYFISHLKNQILFFNFATNFQCDNQSIYSAARPKLGRPNALAYYANAPIMPSKSLIQLGAGLMMIRNLLAWSCEKSEHGGVPNCFNDMPLYAIYSLPPSSSPPAPSSIVQICLSSKNTCKANVIKLFYPTTDINYI